MVLLKLCRLGSTCSLHQCPSRTVCRKHPEPRPEPCLQGRRPRGRLRRRLRALSPTTLASSVSPAAPSLTLVFRSVNLIFGIFCNSLVTYCSTVLPCPMHTTGVSMTAPLTTPSSTIMSSTGSSFLRAQSPSLRWNACLIGGICMSLVVIRYSHPLILVIEMCLDMLRCGPCTRALPLVPTPPSDV
jgi:hypothetical protein